MNKTKASNIRLDKEEQLIEKALERDEFISSADLKKTQLFFKEAAKNYKELQKSKRITIRVNNEDLLKVKSKAQKSQIPYQTLLKILIHNYAQKNTSLSL